MSAARHKAVCGIKLWPGIRPSSGIKLWLGIRPSAGIKLWSGVKLCAGIKLRAGIRPQPGMRGAQMQRSWGIKARICLFFHGSRS